MRLSYLTKKWVTDEARRSLYKVSIGIWFIPKILALLYTPHLEWCLIQIYLIYEMNWSTAFLSPMEIWALISNSRGLHQPRYKYCSSSTLQQRYSFHIQPNFLASSYPMMIQIITRSGCCSVQSHSFWKRSNVEYVWHILYGFVTTNDNQSSRDDISSKFTQPLHRRCRMQMSQYKWERSFSWETRGRFPEKK